MCTALQNVKMSPDLYSRNKQKEFLGGKYRHDLVQSYSHSCRITFISKNYPNRAKINNTRENTVKNLLILSFPCFLFNPF